MKHPSIFFIFNMNLYFVVIEKPRVVYSSAPVINKPEKKKKKKKEEEGGPQGDTGDQSKVGPSGGIVPAMMPVAQPEVKVHEPIHVSYVYMGKKVYFMSITTRVCTFTKPKKKYRQLLRKKN